MCHALSLLDHVRVTLLSWTPWQDDLRVEGPEVDIVKYDSARCQSHAKLTTESVASGGVSKHTTSVHTLVILDRLDVSDDSPLSVDSWPSKGTGKISDDGVVE